jgi:hypothetical protein
VDEAAGKGGVEHEQRAGSHDDADQDDPAPHGRCNDTFSDRSRRTLHESIICRVHTEREGRRTVGHQVDPENLRGQQRKDDCSATDLQTTLSREYDAEEHRHDLADVDDRR